MLIKKIFKIMTTVNLSKIVVWITIIQFVCTMGFYWFTYMKLSKPDTSADDREFVVRTESYIRGLEDRYETRMKHYEQTIDSIEARAFASEIMLKKAKAATTRDQHLIQELLNQKWDTLSTEDKLTDCDTLRELAQNYLVSSQAKDTVYEKQIKEYKEIVHSLAQQVALCDSTNDRLTNKVNESLDQIRASNKEVRKQKRRKNFLKFTTSVLAGIGIYLIAK